MNCNKFNTNVLNLKIIIKHIDFCIYNQTLIQILILAKNR